MAYFSSFVSLLLSLVFLITSMTETTATRVIEPTYPDDIQLCFAAISDTHIQVTDARQHALLEGLEALSDDDIDAVVIAGDITDHGNLDQYQAFYNTVCEGLDGPTLIPAVGNHDTWANDDASIDPDNRAPQSLAYFMDCYNEYSGRSIDKPYYTTVVNGYTIICMSTLNDSTDAYIPDEEIVWLDEELAKATETGLPVFVICHWPINGVNGQDQIWEDGGIGEQSDAVEAVLTKYENVFYISGHEHAGFSGEVTELTKGYQSIEKRNGVNYVNVPCYMYLNTDAGYPASGNGYIIEVYETNVIFRARNIILQHWMPTYDVTVELV